MSFGIGAFPLGFFTSSFNFGNDGVRPAREFCLFMYLMNPNYFPVWMSTINVLYNWSVLALNQVLTLFCISYESNIPNSNTALTLCIYLFIADASEEDQFLSKLFLWVGILFLAWLLLA